MYIEEAIKYSYICLDYAFLKVFVDDISIYNPVFDLTNVDTDVDGELISVPNLDKRNIYKIPNFVELIQISKDKTYNNCLLIMVLDDYRIEELHEWIQYYNKTYGK